MAKAPFQVFVTGTDTGVGKTQVSRALLSLLADAGVRPQGFKPYESGCESLKHPADALALREAAGSTLPMEAVCPHRFRAPLAPGIAAHRLGREPDFRVTLAAWERLRMGPVVVEGAGGLFVPLDSKHDVIDLIQVLRLPVVLVARAGLGTLNHVALSLEALAAREVPVRAVVLSRSTAARDPSERDNRQFLEARHGVPVLGPVPYLEDARARHAAFRRALRPLVSERARGR
ncbi:dethiobiotin synthase [Corallococcus sp. H22C18031201]|uniref:dethiobiotin synthase n=1 Tax=Citreicoccus inhibens TaxID=2849499 RepID=UPI000E7279AD|nr:dethiobiotin synthase [Citreicoccus inhibens]MBU8900524.1 dethiobiotin synthase [Citreicoccus inhibens]RJS16567.1 dethiobiotin synthase [Corallococcus sp. H22C18031201]